MPRKWLHNSSNWCTFATSILKKQKLKSIQSFKKTAAILFVAFFSKTAKAADMADAMRSDGKIWVVVAVITVILIGLFIFLFSIDRKISSVEKQLNQDKKQ